jgi:hypothetical protein
MTRYSAILAVVLTLHAFIAGAVAQSSGIGGTGGVGGAGGIGGGYTAVLGPQYVAYQDNFCNGSTTCVITATCASGHTAVILSPLEGGGPTDTVTNSTSTGNTLTPVYTNTRGNNTTANIDLTVSIVTSCNGSAGTYKATSTRGQTYISYYEVSNSAGLDTSNQCSNQNNGGTQNATPSCSITTTGTNDILIANLLIDGGNGSQGPAPSGFAEVTTVNWSGTGRPTNTYNALAVATGSNTFVPVNSGTSLSGTSANDMVTLIALK